MTWGHASPHDKRQENYLRLRTGLEGLRGGVCSQEGRMGSLDLPQDNVLWLYIGTVLSWLQLNDGLALSSMRGWSSQYFGLHAWISSCLDVSQTLLEDLLGGHGKSLSPYDEC